MSAVPPLASIPVGVVVERSKSASQWADYYWRPAGVLAGVPDTAPWTKLTDDGEHATFYAGAAEIELYRTETTYYRSNIESGAPTLWIALRATNAEPPYIVAAVTADPAEGESLTETATDMVEQVPMPEAIQELVAAFVAEHHVEQPFVKRQRDRANPEVLARRGPPVERK
ncbi:MAG TPA: DUF3305 domain-containing protein [Pseudolabrys sp.]|nr:DUF3305 domain-containing protein [Pseudolabrys sp.]